MLVVVAGLGAAGWWLFQPLALKSSVLDFEVELGQSPHAVAQGLADAGVEVQPGLLFWWFKLSGNARKIKAGSYEIAPGASPYNLLQMLTRGAETLRTVVLVEGWNLRQLREALAREDGITVIFVTHSVMESAYLSSRVLVMSPRPGKITADIALSQGPHDRLSPAFAQAQAKVAAALMAAA